MAKSGVAPLNPQSPDGIHPLNGTVSRSALAGTPVRSAWREYGLPLILLMISIVTMTAIGARFMQNFQHGLPTVADEADLWPWPWLFADPSRFLLGWPFSLSLLCILLTHEFGHYIACRWHGIRATLPMVLPAPTLSGTAGAVIQLRSRIPNRRALMDVGVYGPLAGYAATLAVIAIGLLLSAPAPREQPAPLVDFGHPLTLQLVDALLRRLHPAMPAYATATWHPVLMAGWIGLLVTALNLIPGGQLDGGHILYALWPRIHRKLRYLIPAALLACGIFFWLGWIFWGLLLFIPAMRHPRVPEELGLDRKRLLLGAIALAIFALTFSFAPFTGSSVLHYFQH